MAISVIAVAALLAAAVPVTRERLDRFVTLTGLSVTPANARQVIDHFTVLRRWRLITLVVAVPPALLTDDPFYLVVGWCAVSVFHGVRSPAPISRAPGDAGVYRRAWLLGSAAAAVAGVHLLTSRDVTPVLLAHAVIVVIVMAAVPLVAWRTSAGPASGEPDDAVWAGQAVGHWSTRGLYLAGTAVMLSSVILAPGRSPLPEYSSAKPLSKWTATFTTVRGYKEPTCSWSGHLDAPCRSWRVNGTPFPQAAPYVIRPGGAPRLAPFVRSPDKKAVVYLGRDDRRMAYQDARGVHRLTGALADTAVPTPAFLGQNRYVVLNGDGAQVIDTRTWAPVPVPGARRVHDLNGSGTVFTTASQVLVADLRGRTRMSLPLRKEIKDSPEDAYHLRPDGRRLVVIRGHEGRVETFDVTTGRLLRGVVPRFRGDDSIDIGLGWSEQGSFLVRGAVSERVYHLDLSTGKLWRRDG
ncbi:hypothetical protein ACWDR9_10935 [Streptosporangium sandarakinum]